MNVFEIRKEIEAWRDRKKRARKMEQFGMLHIARGKIIKLKGELRRIKSAAAQLAVPAPRIRGTG